MGEEGSFGRGAWGTRNLKDRARAGKIVFEKRAGRGRTFFKKRESYKILHRSGQTKT